MEVSACVVLVSKLFVKCRADSRDVHIGGNKPDKGPKSLHVQRVRANRCYANLLCYLIQKPFTTTTTPPPTAHHTQHTHPTMGRFATNLAAYAANVDNLPPKDKLPDVSFWEAVLPGSVSDLFSDSKKVSWEAVVGLSFFQ